MSSQLRVFSPQPLSNATTFTLGTVQNVQRFLASEVFGVAWPVRYVYYIEGGVWLLLLWLVESDYFSPLMLFATVQTGQFWRCFMSVVKDKARAKGFGGRKSKTVSVNLDEVEAEILSEPEPPVEVELVDGGPAEVPSPKPDDPAVVEEEEEVELPAVPEPEPAVAAKPKKRKKSVARAMAVVPSSLPSHACLRSCRYG